MYQAQYLFEGDVVFSPWMPRQGDNIWITLDLIANSDTSNNLLVELYEKNTEDPGDGLVVPGGQEIDQNDPGLYDTSYSATKELVRYRFAYASSGTGDDHALFRMLPPRWYDTVSA